MDSFLGFAKNTPIIITGAGSGIGEAVAKLAARQGLAVSAWDISEAGSARTTAAIRAEGGVCHAFSLNVSNPDEVQTALQETQNRLGEVRCLAAVAAPPSFGTLDFSEGVKQTIDCARIPTEAWLATTTEGPRSAVYLSSVQGPRYGAGVQWYTVAKTAVDGYMRSVAAMRPGGLRANAVLPDWVLTPRTEEYVAATGGPGWEANPMGRVGFTRDVANAILFLLSPAAEYLNGVSLEIDGGSRLRSLAWMRMRGASKSATLDPPHIA